MVRSKALLTLALVGLLIISSVTVEAGDENNPEVYDVDGDAASGKDSHDLLWGFIGNELNDTFNVVMGLTSLEMFTDPNLILTFPVTHYKFYFTLLGVNYVAVATVPVHGPLGIDIQYELRTVMYNGTTPANETDRATISTARYDTVNGIVNMTIEKSDVGNPNEGDRAENIWCAVYSQERQDGFTLTDPELEDKAPNNGYGKPYVFRGSVGNEIIRMEIKTDGPMGGNISAGQRLQFEINVLNNGTVGLEITMSNSSADAWSVSFTPSTFHLDDQAETNVTLSVKMKNLRQIKNGDTLNLQVYAETNIGNETSPITKTSNFLTFSIKASVPPPAKEKKEWWEEMFDGMSEWLEDNGETLGYAIGAIIGVAVALAVVVMVLKRRSKKEEEGEEFKDLDVDLEEEKEPAATEGNA